jgi:large subunit ribosomal protein L1
MGKKHGKKYLMARARIEKGKQYPIEEAIALLREIAYEKFDPTVELHVNLGVDPRHADQMVRGTVSLPHGTGKEVKIAVLTTPDKEKAVKEMGVEYVGLDDLLEDLANGKIEVDVVLATQDAMPKVAKYGRQLGPKGLMPSPKSGTVVPPDLEAVQKAVQEFKAGKLDFRVDKYGIVHIPVGKLKTMTDEQLVENAKEVIATILALKPENIKGNYLQEIYVATTMSPGVLVQKNSLVG